MQEISVACSGRFGWRLRWAARIDLEGLHAIACQPAVYRYLFDGRPPARKLILERIEEGIVDTDRVGFALWVLEAPAIQYGGCGYVEPDQLSRSGELLYFLDCSYWGQGLATRMAWTAITQAFRTPYIDCVFAGADRPNQASIAVMRRLGMTFRRDVQYPLLPGIEYAIHRDDPRPSHAPALLSIGRQERIGRPVWVTTGCSVCPAEGVRAGYHPSDFHLRHYRPAGPRDSAHNPGVGSRSTSMAWPPVPLPARRNGSRERWT